jgi:hypothetical protein
MYPGYASIDVVKGNTDIHFYVNANGDHSESTSPHTPSSDILFPLSEVANDFAAVMSQKIATLAHTPESQLRYMIVETDPDTKKLVWYAYTAPGSAIDYFQMNAPNGRLFEDNSTTGLKRVKG